MVMMMYGHTVSALLDKTYQTGTWFQVWTFQRGMTSGLFLFLSGFAFSIATMRHWPVHTRFSPAVWKRARRFALFIVLGYAMHSPVRHAIDIASATDAKWRAFLAVDVLQLVGVTLLLLQLLVLAAQSRRVFIAVTCLLAALLIGITPMAWAFDYGPYVPPAIGAYLSPSGGSLFPLIPWSGFALAGAAAGGLFARWGAAHLGRFANLVLLAPGVLLLLVGLSAGRLPVLAAAGPFGGVLAAILMRFAACLILLSLMAHASRRLTHLPHVFGAIAQESLLVYFVHLAIVYGSPWNTGLYRFFALSLSPLQTLLAVVAIVGAMFLLAWHWNRLKHHRPRAARWISVATGAAMVAWLI